MKPLDQLKSILGRTYNYYEENESITLLPGMSDLEISEFKERLPNHFLPADIEELLRFSRGFHLGEWEYIYFNIVYSNEWFPHYVPLLSEIGGPDNWVIDIDSAGNWGTVYYVLYDSEVIVKHVTNLSEFIQYWDARHCDPDAVDDVGGIAMDIFHSKKGRLQKKSIKRYGAPKEFVRKLPLRYRIADLTNAPQFSGFSWWKYSEESRAWRLGDQPVWVIAKKNKWGGLRRLLGLK